MHDDLSSPFIRKFTASDSFITSELNKKIKIRREKNQQVFSSKPANNENECSFRIMKNKLKIKVLSASPRKRYFQLFQTIKKMLNSFRRFLPFVLLFIGFYQTKLKSSWFLFWTKIYSILFYYRYFFVHSRILIEYWKRGRIRLSDITMTKNTFRY